ncbi:MAG: pyridoxamine 5'-phosphate oxidase family protein [Thermomicrobiales bacterium]
MGRRFDALDDTLVDWIGAQPLFFVATAPTDPSGHLNISPKGGQDTFRVLGPTTVAYLDLNGSGIETVAHLRDNGRIVLMFCAFAGPPKILRLHGHGRIVQEHEPEFSDLLKRFRPAEEILSVLRSIVVVDVTRIADSCGFVVPRMDFVEERDQLFRWAERKRDQGGEDWALKYRQANNATSIDGSPGLDVPQPVDNDVEHFSSAGRAL